MGKEERANKEAVRLGKFNVKLHIVFLDDMEMEVDCKSWTPGPSALALDINSAHLRIIPNTSIKFFDVTPLDGGKEIIIQ